jgi:hypothetical protein
VPFEAVEIHLSWPNARADGPRETVGACHCGLEPQSTAKRLRPTSNVVPGSSRVTARPSAPARTTPCSRHGLRVHVPLQLRFGQAQGLQVVVCSRRTLSVRNLRLRP